MNATITYDVLCSACEKIFDVGRLEAMIVHEGETQDALPKFHSLLSDLRLSAESSCHLCSLLLGELDSKSARKAFDKIGGADFQIFTKISHEIYLEIHGKSLNDEGVMKEVGSIRWAPGEETKVKQILCGRLRSRGFHRSYTDQISIWLKECMANHTLCSNSWRLIGTEKSHPTRLLDVGSDTVASHVFLRTDGEIPTNSEYLTLSHRWGNKKPLCLKSKTLTNFQNGILVDELPRTFKDAIELTRQCGYRYLWIDSLCIIQDSAEDWRIESSRMGATYAFAVFNISATGAEDSHGGLFSSNFPLSQHPCIVPVPQPTSTVPPNSVVCFIRDTWEEKIETAQLVNRGWVIQERILAPRVLHFTTDMMFWQCWKEQLGEFHFPLTMDVFNIKWSFAEICQNDQHRAYLDYDWWILVERYSICKLTEKADKLSAFAGLAARFRHQFQVETECYLAGLWRPTLVHDLLWSVVRHEDIEAQRVAGRAPSWSWASLDGKIDGPMGAFVNESQVTILSAATTTEEHAPLGRVLSGYIRIQGPVLSLITLAEIAVSQRNSVRNNVTWDVAISEDEKNGAAFLIVQHVRGLALRWTGEKGRFERLGILEKFPPKSWGTLFEMARDRAGLPEEWFFDWDKEKGFVIELV